MNWPQGTPRWFWSIATNVEGFQNGPGPVGPITWLVRGIDLYPGIQPNNGAISVGLSLAGAGTQTIFEVQQSANFPGPFSWRGLIPFFGTGLTFPLDTFFLENNVPVTASVWGLQVPAFNLG